MSDYTEPEYLPHDKIQLIDLQCEGTVRLIRYDGAKFDYYCTWWSDGQRREGWLERDEIAKSNRA